MDDAYSCIAENDYLRIVRLVTDMVLAENPAARHRLLVRGIGQLMDAPLAVVIMGGVRGTAFELDHASLQTIGWDGNDCLRRTTAAQEYNQNPLNGPAIRRYGDRPWIALDRREFFDDREWLRFPYVQNVARPLDMGPSIYAGCFLGSPARRLFVTVHRPWKDRCQFSRRDAQCAGLLMETVHRMDPLFQPSEDPTAGLSPRRRSTLAGLLAGRSEKEIATELGLSQSTVHHYATMLYHHFGVHSVRELLAALLPPER